MGFRLTDGTLPESAYDLVCMFDAFHHVPDPEALLDAMRRALRPGGAILVAEPLSSGDPTTDADDPPAVLTYADGGHGFGAVEARGGLEALLPEHGFGAPTVHESDAGYAVIRALAVPG